MHHRRTKGMTQLICTMEKVKKQINPPLKIDGAVLTLADMRTKKMVATTQRMISPCVNSRTIVMNASLPVARLFYDVLLVGLKMLPIPREEWILESRHRLHRRRVAKSLGKKENS